MAKYQENNKTCVLGRYLETFFHWKPMLSRETLWKSKAQADMQQFMVCHQQLPQLVASTCGNSCRAQLPRDDRIRPKPVHPWSSLIPLPPILSRRAGSWQDANFTLNGNHTAPNQNKANDGYSQLCASRGFCQREKSMPLFSRRISRKQDWKQCCWDSNSQP